MKIDRPLWSAGALLSPQQFQQQARWEAWANESLAHLSLIHPWGVQAVAFDSEALRLGKLKATQLRLRMPDGTLIDTDYVDRLPPALEIAKLPPESIQNATLLLALAIACAVTLVPTLPQKVSSDLWQQLLRDKFSLIDGRQSPETAGAMLPFPDPLLHLLPAQNQNSPARRASVIALWLFGFAGVIALTNSAWQNNLLLRQVSDDLRRYNTIPQPDRQDQPEFAAREKAIAVLREDAKRLDSYYRHGEPLALGLGLYHGERLRLPVLDIIARHRQPMAPAPLKTAKSVRLDSLSLFSTGSAQLKPDSTKVLITALVGIKAQPGWLIVIAGHTDSTGNAESNLLLSRARAAAVREWMQRMGEIPDSCFAVQGFGASQPVASNDTENGRAANRRVDIRLVPEVGACVLSTAESGRPPQPQTAAFNQ